MKLAILLVILALPGCISSAERQARWAAADENQCVGYGFTQGTDQFASCRMRLDQNRRQRIQNALDSMTVPQPRFVTCFSTGRTTSCY